MKYETFKHRLEELHRRYGPHLNSMEVTANKINGISYLIFKNTKNNEIRDVIILKDEKEKTAE